MIRNFVAEVMQCTIEYVEQIFSGVTPLPKLLKIIRSTEEDGNPSYK